MLNIISFLVFSILAGKLIAKKSFGKEAVIMAAVCGYMGILDLVNTNSTLLTNGASLALLSFVIRGIVAVSAVLLLKKYERIAVRSRNKVVRVNFSVQGMNCKKAS